MRSRVDLPEPLRPTRQIRSPVATARPAPASSGVTPKVTPMSCSRSNGSGMSQLLALSLAPNGREPRLPLSWQPGRAVARVQLVETGRSHVVIGRSGSGKSTLLRCINGLERPDSGTIEFDGKAFEPTPRRLKALRREIGIVFQSYNLFPHLCVERNITLGPTAAKGIEPAAARELARKVLRMVDLEDKIAAYPQQLSGGQQQRVAIARALAMEPRLVLFDEITAALDPELIGDVVRVLDKLARDGMTMVLVTHEMGFARRSADTIVFMHQGRIWEKGPPAKLFDAPATTELQAFIDAILSVGPGMAPLVASPA